MAAKLGGRNIRTVLTNLELLSDDGKTVLSFGLNEDRTVVIKMRAPHESSWHAKTSFSVDRDDARMVGYLMSAEDVQWRSVDDIERQPFTAPEPEDVIEARLREKIGDCSELDIERAKATRIAEEKELLKLQMERDHALDKHITADVPGCPACERKFTTGIPNPYEDNIRATHIDDEATDASNDKEVPW